MPEKLHSSLQGRYTYLAKIGERGSLADEKAARKGEERRQLLAAQKAVDARDGGRCRVCGRRCSPRALSLVDRAERHHMVSRRYDDTHTTKNLVTLCAGCHGLIHTAGTLHVSGDADLTDTAGKFCGIRIERLKEHGWDTERMA